MTTEPTLKCFVLSPIGADGTPERAAADKVLRHIIKKALEPTYEVIRADEEANPGAITPQFVAAITSADLIVADISGQNPNVFYELAIAHGFRKPTVHIQRKSDKIPFDIKDMRIITYDITDPDEIEAAKTSITRSADYARKNPDKLETPLTASEKFSSVTGSTDPVAESNVRVMEAIEELTSEVKKALRPRNVQLTRPVAESALEEDVRSYQKIIRSVMSRSQLILQDLANTLTVGTSGSFDDWVRDTAELIEPFPINDHDDTLMSAEMIQRIATEESDAAPF